MGKIPFNHTTFVSMLKYKDDGVMWKWATCWFFLLGCMLSLYSHTYIYLIFLRQLDIIGSNKTWKIWSLHRCWCLYLHGHSFLFSDNDQGRGVVNRRESVLSDMSTSSVEESQEFRHKNIDSMLGMSVRSQDVLVFFCYINFTVHSCIGPSNTFHFQCGSY